MFDVWAKLRIRVVLLSENFMSVFRRGAIRLVTRDRVQADDPKFAGTATKLNPRGTHQRKRKFCALRLMGDLEGCS